MIPLEESAFVKLVPVIYALTGMSVGNDKRYLVELRLQSVLKKHKLKSFDELVDHLTFSPQVYQRELIEQLTTRETSFFRDLNPFRWFEQYWLPKQLKSKNKLRIWSAACSSGQELWSLAMLLEQSALRSSFDYELVGTDLSEHALVKARSGHYTDLEISRGLDPEKLKRYFRKSDPYYEIHESLRSKAKFYQMNLLQPRSDLGNFDLILCRNVAIYFAEAERQILWKNLMQRCLPDGNLLLGSAETMGPGAPWTLKISEGQSVYFPSPRTQ